MADWRPWSSVREVGLRSICMCLSVLPLSARINGSHFGKQCAEKNIEVCKSLIDLANIELSKQRRPCRDVRICYDEVSS